MKLMLGAIGIVFIVVIVLVAVDVASTPTPAAGACVFVKRIVLPDICIASCTPTRRVDCTATTRPYLIFFTQSATCATLGAICLGNSMPQRTLSIAQSVSAPASCS
jgi:hypothetical protein